MRPIRKFSIAEQTAEHVREGIRSGRWRGELPGVLVLAGLLRQLALYVNMHCQNDRAILLSSGFPTWKPTRTPVGILPAPETPVLGYGERSGELVASTVPVPNGAIYNWRVGLPGATPDIKVRVQTTAASYTFTNLTPGQIYLVDVNVVGSAGPSDYSDTAQLMVV